MLRVDDKIVSDGDNPGIHIGVTLEIPEVPIVIGFSGNERIWKNGVLLCLGGIAAGVLWLIVRARGSRLVLGPSDKSV